MKRSGNSTASRRYSNIDGVYGKKGQVNRDKDMHDDKQRHASNERLFMQVRRKLVEKYVAAG